MADSKLNYFVSAGTNAQRVAFTPTPPSPAAGPTPGYFWYETDTGNTYSWKAGTGWQQVISGLTAVADGDLLANISGGSAAPIANTLSAILDHVLGSTQGDVLYRGASAWAALAPGTSGQVLTTGGAAANPSWATAGGGITLISEVVTSASQASVTFSSIPSTYRDLLVIVRGRGDAAALSVKVRIQFNSDTGTNYQYEVVRYAGTSSGVGQATGQTSIDVLDDLPAGTATANFAGWVESRIFDYKGTTFYKTVGSTSGSHLGTTTNTNEAGVYSGQWNSTVAINAISIFLSAGNFVDGSVVSLYGTK